MDGDKLDVWRRTGLESAVHEDGSHSGKTTVIGISGKLQYAPVIILVAQKSLASPCIPPVTLNVNLILQPSEGLGEAVSLWISSVWI